MVSLSKYGIYRPILLQRLEGNKKWFVLKEVVAAEKLSEIALHN